jgi:bacterioferritin
VAERYSMPMNGHPQVIAALNGLLVDELAAVDQYLAHAHKLRHWGYVHLAERLSHEVEDEKSHAEALIRRILFLEGEPCMTPSPVTIGKSVVEILQLDLAVERRVRENLVRTMALCEAERDFGSRELLVPLLKDTEEDHMDWLEQQLELIQTLGLPFYLQKQIA